MKHRFLIITLTLIALLLCSCEQEKPLRQPTYEKITSSEMANGTVAPGKIPGDYLYHSTENGLLLKYHIPTGTATTVCQDPFCTHDDMVCPFAIPWFCMDAIGNVLYYTVRIDDQWHLRSYDGDTMEVKEIRASNGILAYPTAYNYYLYFQEKTETKTEGEYNTTVYRLDTQSGVLDVIDCGYESAKIEDIAYDRLIWENDGAYFSTDLDGDDEQYYHWNYGRQWGNYMYTWEAKTPYVTKLSCKDLTTGEKILIFDENISSFFFYGDKILYFKPVEDPEIWYSDAYGTHYDTLGGNVYIMNLDGSDKKLLCHVDNCPIMGESRSNRISCGDWVGIHTYCMYEDEHGFLSLEETDLLVVNVVTGDYRYIKYNPYE